MQISKPLLLFGTATMAKLMLNYYISSKQKVIALCVDENYIPYSATALGLPVLPFESIEKHYSPDQYDICIAIGYKNINNIRRIKSQEAVAKGYNLAGFIHPSAIVADNVKIGIGAIILEKVIIQPGVSIGEGVVLGPGSIICHDSVIEKWVWMGNTIIGGECTIGAYSFLGLNSTVSSGIKIGKNCIIGACSSILKNLPDESAVITSNDTPLKLPPKRIFTLANKLLYGIQS